MNLEPAILEVGGGTGNSAILISIAMVSCAAALFAYRGVCNASVRRSVMPLLLPIGLVVLAKPIVRLVAAVCFYMLPARRFLGVHFWGLSPFWWAIPLCAVGAALAATLTRRRIAA
jgi:hypothetical protein